MKINMEDNCNYYESIAFSILDELGYISKCDFCEYYVFNEFELSDEVFRNATRKFKEKYPGDKNFKDFHLALKTVYEEGGLESIKDHIEGVHLND